MPDPNSTNRSNQALTAIAMNIDKHLASRGIKKGDAKYAAEFKRVAAMLKGTSKQLTEYQGPLPMRSKTYIDKAKKAAAGASKAAPKKPVKSMTTGKAAAKTNTPATKAAR